VAFKEAINLGSNTVGTSTKVVEEDFLKEEAKAFQALVQTSRQLNASSSTKVSLRDSKDISNISFAIVTKSLCDLSLKHIAKYFRQKLPLWNKMLLCSWRR